MSLTSIGLQKTHQMLLFSTENSDKCLEIGDTSANKNTEKYDVPITWLWNVHNMISLFPSDAWGFRVSKLTDKGHIRVHAIQQFNPVDDQLDDPIFI